MSEPADDLMLWLAFDRAARAHAEAPAVVDAAGATTTYAAIHERAEDAAEHLQGAMGASGGVVALLAQDPASTITWMLAALRSGAAVTNVTPAAFERDAQLALVQPDVVVSCDPSGGVILRAAPTSELGPPPAAPRLPPGVPRLPPGVPRLPPGVIVCTAGTTGRPKAVVHSHATLAHAVRRLQLFRLEAAGMPDRIPADDDALREDLVREAASDAWGLRYATTLPLTTMAGLTVALQALLAGDCLVMTSMTDPTALLHAVATNGVTNLSLTPLLAQLVVRAARRGGVPDLPRLAFAGIGGGPIVPAVAAALETALGCAVAVGYGTTEAGGALTMGCITDPPEMRHATVGRPLPGVRVAVNPRTHELLVRCASTAVGYLSAPGMLTELSHLEYRTGDLARVRPDGTLELLGRADSIILRGGRNVDPVRIERALEDHPAVEHAAVFGVANRSISGEQDIWSAVVLTGRGSTDGRHPPVREAELRAHCNVALGPALTPRRIVAVDALPRTVDGAVRRYELAALTGARAQPAPSDLEERHA